MSRRKEEAVTKKSNKGAMGMAVDAADKVKKAALKKRAGADSSEDELEGVAGSEASISSFSDDDEKEQRRKLAATNKMHTKELDDLHSTKSGIQKKIDDVKHVNEAKLKELRETCNSFSSDIAVCDLFIKIFFSHLN